MQLSIPATILACLQAPSFLKHFVIVYVSAVQSHFWRIWKLVFNVSFVAPCIRANFPASRGLFSVVFAELTGARKRDLCPGSKRTVLSMRHGYLATEPSRDALNYAGSLNDSGVTVNKCARDSRLKSRSVNNTGSMRFVSAVHDFGRRLNQSPFRPRAEVSFRRPRQFSECNGKEASASRERANIFVTEKLSQKICSCGFTQA